MNHESLREKHGMPVDTAHDQNVYFTTLIAPRWISRKASGGVIFCLQEVVT